MRNEWQPVTVTRESIASILTRNRLTVWHRVTVNNRVEYQVSARQPSNVHTPLGKEHYTIQSAMAKKLTGHRLYV